MSNIHGVNGSDGINKPSVIREMKNDPEHPTAINRVAVKNKHKNVLNEEIQVKTLSREALIRVLPKKVKNAVTPELVDAINAVKGADHYREAFKDNLVNYTSVLEEGKFKILDYVNAVKYCSSKLLGASNIVSYARAFPERYDRLINEGMADDDIAHYVSAYNRNKLVNLIMAQTLVPMHVLNADMYQKALNTQAQLMIGAKSEKVRSDAANSLLTHLKAPEAIKMQLDIGVSEDSSIDLLRQSTLELVKQQRLMIESTAMTPKEVAHSTLVLDVPAEDVEGP